MREWWRWTLRGGAVLALVGGGVVLALRPTASYRLLGNRLALSAQCVSPFDRLRGEPVSPILVDSIPPASAIPNIRAVDAACSRRDHRTRPHRRGAGRQCRPSPWPVVPSTTQGTGYQADARTFAGVGGSS